MAKEAAEVHNMTIEVARNIVEQTSAWVERRPAGTSLDSKMELAVDSFDLVDFRDNSHVSRFA